MRITFHYKVYTSKKNRYLHNLVDIAWEVYIYCIRFHKTYYRLYKKHLDKHKLQKYITQVKKRPEYSHWNELGSQAIQDVVDRIEGGYDTFFLLLKKGRRCAPPSFRKKNKYKSFTLKQAGYKLLEGNQIKIGKKVFKFHKSREIEGQIKTVTIKRDSLGDIYIYFSCEVPDPQPTRAPTGKIVGIDFGLKTFLTLSNGQEIQAPLPLLKSLNELKKASKSVSSKQKGSNNQQWAFSDLARQHKKVACQRRDFHVKCAKSLLADDVDVLVVEDLHIAAMQKLWGRQISDLGFAAFLKILTHEAQKAGVKIVIIDRFYPSSKQCHKCLAINNDLSLKDREWECSTCHAFHQRDLNAALNIKRVGASTLGLGNVRPTELAIAA